MRAHIVSSHFTGTRLYVTSRAPGLNVNKMLVLLNNDGLTVLTCVCNGVQLSTGYHGVRVAQRAVSAHSRESGPRALQLLGRLRVQPATQRTKRGSATYPFVLVSVFFIMIEIFSLNNNCQLGSAGEFIKIPCTIDVVERGSLK